jgi:hypothetical protein
MARTPTQKKFDPRQMALPLGFEALSETLPASPRHCTITVNQFFTFVSGDGATTVQAQNGAKNVLHREKEAGWRWAESLEKCHKFGSALMAILRSLAFL